MSEAGSGGPSPEQVRREAEAVLLRVITAGRVAEVLWRLLGSERVRRWSPVEAGGEQEGAVVRRKWQSARDAIACTVHEHAPRVYHAAVQAARQDGDVDLAALALAELAGLHLRLGYVSDCLWLVELAGAEEGLSHRAHQVLATVRAWATNYERRQHDINAEHDGSSPSDHER